MIHVLFCSFFWFLISAFDTILTYTSIVLQMELYLIYRPYLTFVSYHCVTSYGINPINLNDSW